MFNEEEIVRLHKTRADLTGNIVLICFLIILSRLWYLQIYKGKTFYIYSLENRLRKDNIQAPRGMIFSRDNAIMVQNIPRFDAIITPQYLKNKTETIDKLAKILDMTSEQVQKVLQKNQGQASYIPIVIKKNISDKELAIIETENSKMPGVSVTTFISREYAEREMGGHVLGYISEISPQQLPRYRKRDNINYKLGDFIGQAGVEEQHDLLLRGEDGYEFVEVDARGRLKRHFRNENLFGEIENKAAKPGNNIRLTIDRDLQITGYKALEGKVGSAVAIDVNTGEILAMVSRPSFDPSQFSRGLTPEYWASLVNDDKNPLRDRTIQEHYSPGSTFKTFTAIAALEEGIVDENTEVVCNGTFRLGRRIFHCWKKHGHGKVNLSKSISQSCDVYYYKIGTQMDIDTLAKYAHSLGLGKKTGIALPRETMGLIPTKDWKKKRNGQDWHRGETLSCVIGQSFVLTTPIQLAQAYATIANGGKLLTPYLIKEVFTSSGEVLKRGETVEEDHIQFSKRTMDLVKKGLVEVVNSPTGTAWWQRGRGIKMAGKTGTSQVMSFSADKIFQKCEEKEYKHRHHAIFAGYAPYDNPKIAVGVVVEHGCHGSSAAGPVARDIITTYMQKYYPEELAKNIQEESKIRVIVPKKPVVEEEETPIQPVEDDSLSEE